MSLYKLFSCNVEIQYKSCLFSKATFFTVVTTLLTIILPFILAHRSRGFWLKSHHFFEQPTLHSTYEYLLVAESDDPSQPIVCGSANDLVGGQLFNEEHCAEFQVEEIDYNNDNKIDLMNFNFKLNIPLDKHILSVTIILGLDYQLKMVCPLHMQSLGIITKDFVTPSSEFKFIGDLKLYQNTHLPCVKYHVDTKHNVSLFDYKGNHEDMVDFVLQKYYKRDVTSQIFPLFSRSHHGHTGSLTLDISIRIPEIEVLYLPSLLQELKWAWPQYLSLVIIFYWIFDKIKKFVFNKRLLMAWEVVPWKRSY